MSHNVISYNDPRQIGEALWESWIGKSIYEGIRAEDENDFSAIYQQEPSKVEGNIFKQKHFRYYSETPDFITLGDIKIRKKELRIYQTIDPAGTVSQTADDFACVTFAIHNNNIIVLDTFAEQALTTEHESLIEGLKLKWNPISQAVEKEKFGLVILQRAKEKGFPLVPLKADKNKIYRAEPLQVHFKNGLVWFNNSFAKLEKQLLEFPNGKHDDLVDCLAYAVILLFESKEIDIVKAWHNIYD